MVTLDYIVIAVVLVSAVVGLVQGFLRQICAFIFLVLAIFLAWKLAPAIAPHLGGALEEAAYGLWAARAIVFVVVLVVGAIIGAIVNYYVRLSMFSALDRFLGFVLGTLRGVVIVGVIVILAQAARLHEEGWWQKSRLVPYFEPIANVLRALAGDRLPPALTEEG